MAAAYEAYKSNGLRGNPGSLIPHLYEDYTSGNQPGLFCYQVNGEDIPSSIVVGTYLGGIPGETMLEAENRGRPVAREDLEEANGSWADYLSDENLCCGPEKAFYYCSPILGEVLNITDCRQEPQYRYVGPEKPSGTTTLSTRFSDGTGEDGAILCGCVLNRGTAGPIRSMYNIAEDAEQIIQEYSTSGAKALSVAGVLTVLVASALPSLLMTRDDWPKPQ